MNDELRSGIPLAYARGYLRRGFRVVPVPEGQKAPVLKNWQHLCLTEADLPEYFSNRSNIGLLVGEPSGHLVDIDLDCPVARLLAADFLPETDLISGRPGSPKSHRWYISKIGTAKFIDPICEDRKKGTLVEIRSTGAQTVVPPSVHPSGEIYEWSSKGRPAEIDPIHLLAATRELAGCALLARHWTNGKRHELALALAGTLSRHGWSQDRVEHFIVYAARGAGDPEIDDRRKAVVTTAIRLTDGRDCKGIPSLRTLLPVAVVDKLLQWLDLEAGNCLVNSVGAKGKDEPESVPWPEVDPVALYGLAGDIVRAIEPHSEADPAALLLQTLVAFGNCVGRSPYFRVEGDRHHLNLSAVIVGVSSKARKGTSWGQVRRAFKSVDEDWISDCVQAGVSTGEGLIWAVRDPIEKKEPVKEKGRVTGYQTIIADHGVEDKRLLVQEPEFAKVLRVMAREGNTLSPVIRQAWDSGDLRVLTKTSAARATGAHISIVGHITAEELRRNLDETESANGFANRILWAQARRSKFLPEGGSLKESDLKPLQSRLSEAIQIARQCTEITRDEGARKLWCEVYRDLSSGYSGLFGAVTSRAEAQVLRLSCVYALLDGLHVIGRQHLEAAIAVWKYCEDSARFIFGQATGDRTADVILDALSEAGEQGLTKTQLSDLFSRKKQAAEINRALTLLQERGLINSRKEHTEGRSSLRYFLTSAEAKKAKEAKEAPDESMQAELSSLNSLNSPEVEVDVIAAERLAIQEEGYRCDEPVF